MASRHDADLQEQIEALFDADHYLDRYRDVALASLNPLEHFLTFGAIEGRSPNPLFDTQFYLQQNPSVAAAGLNPLAHYVSCGADQGCDPNPLFDTRYYLEQNPDVAAAGRNPLLHYIRQGASERRDPNPLFDTSFYLEQNPDVAARGVNPLAHYLAYGAAEGRDPNPLFDTSYYLEQNPDVAAGGLNPLAHYLAFGEVEGRDPNPLFDTSYYVERYAVDLAQHGLNPLAHYLAVGAEDGCAPNPLFDTSFYVEQYPDVKASGLNPLAHYLTFGVILGYDPNPLFHTAYYLRRYPDVAAASTNPLVHFIEHGTAERRDPNRLFDTTFYLEHNPDVGALDLNPLVHYLELGAEQGRNPCALFDSSFYLERYPDVAELGLNPLAHYLLHGADDRRDPNPLFNVSFYLGQNPDVSQAGLSALDHYVTYGVAEGRDPNPLFDTSFYLSAHHDVLTDRTNPLAHFLSSGDREPRDPNPLFDSSYYLEQHPEVAEAGINPLAHFLALPRVGGELDRLFASPATGRLDAEVRVQLARSICIYTPRRAFGDDEPEMATDQPRRRSLFTADGRLIRGIAVVSHDAEHNGAQLIALSIVRELAATYDTQIFVLLQRGGPLTLDFAALAPTAVLRPDEIQGGDDNLSQLMWVFRRLGIDAAICNTVVAADMISIFRSFGVRTVSLIHEQPMVVRESDNLQRFEKALRLADFVVFPSQTARQQLAEAFDVHVDRARIIPQGLLRPNPLLNERRFARLQVCKQFNIPLTSPIVLACGLGSLRKGYDLFVLLCSILSRRSPRLDVHFVWAGAEDGHHVRWSAHDVVQADLADRAHVTGTVDHAGLYFAAADLFVLPSREDPFPTVCLEAMEAGLPIVAFEGSGGVADAIGGEAGLLVPYLDIIGMADAIEHLLTDDTSRARLGAAGRRRVQEHFQLSHYIEALVSLITSPTSDRLHIARPTRHLQ